MPWFTAWVAGRPNLGFGMEGGFWTASWGALVITPVSFPVSLLIKDEQQRATGWERSF